MAKWLFFIITLACYSMSLCLSAISYVLLLWTRELSQPIIRGQQLFPREARFIHKNSSHCISYKHIERHTVTVFTTLTVQNTVLPNEECLYKSVPSRCVYIDLGDVKYYNEKNSKVVSARQQLSYVSRVCILLVEMENFPVKPKTPFCSPVSIEQCEHRVSRCHPTRRAVLCFKMLQMCLIHHPH